MARQAAKMALCILPDHEGWLEGALNPALGVVVEGNGDTATYSTLNEMN